MRRWSNQLTSTDTLGYTESFEYDNKGRCIFKNSKDGGITVYEFDSAGCVLSITDAMGAKTDFTYDKMYHILSGTDALGNTLTYDTNGNLTQECLRNYAETTYQYDTENRLKAVKDGQKLLMAAAYDGDGNRTFQLNYNPEAVCGYGKNVSGEVFMPENSKNEDGSLTAEGDLFGYICSATGRSYDLTEYVNDTNRQYTEVLTAYTVNSGATESYSYNGRQRLSQNSIWTEARD